MIVKKKGKPNSVITLETLFMVSVCGKMGIHLTAIPGRVAPSQLGALVWTALRAEENRLGLPLNPIHRLSVHQSEPPPSHDSFVLSVGLAFILAYTFLHS